MIYFAEENFMKLSPNAHCTAQLKCPVLIDVQGPLFTGRAFGGRLLGFTFRHPDPNGWFVLGTMQDRVRVHFLRPPRGVEFETKAPIPKASASGSNLRLDVALRPS